MESNFLKSLPESELEEINYTDNQSVIYWQEDDEDFIFNSRLYDVAKKKTINGIVYLYCIKGYSLKNPFWSLRSLSSPFKNYRKTKL